MLRNLLLGKLLPPWRLLLKLFTEADASPQLAAGFALGMMIGLLPKGNLLAAVLAVVLLAVRVNLTAAATGTLLFTLVGLFLDPLTHRLGAALLGWGPLQSIWSCLYNWPIVPWTHFNNTVVLGSLLLGLVLVGPVFWAAWRAIERYRPWVVERIEKLRVARGLDTPDKLAKWSPL